jgi:transcriptional regulator with XRE-family HTH domain
MVELRVKEVCDEKGITSAAELARISGLGFAKANELFQNKITGGSAGRHSVGILTLHRLAQALQVRLSDLYIETDDQ